MAPGYILAICLEACGLLAFAIGAGLTRHERRAKSVGLKRFLVSGQASEATIAPAPVSRPRRDPPAPRALAVPSQAPRTDSDAALALRSAFAAPIR